MEGNKFRAGDAHLGTDYYSASSNLSGLRGDLFQMKECDKFGLKGSRQVCAFLGCCDRESCKRENAKEKGNLKWQNEGLKKTVVSKQGTTTKKCLGKNAYVP